MRYKHTQAGDEACLQGTSGGSYPGYLDSRCYWNYWRVLTAAGTEITHVINDPIPKEYFYAETEFDQQPLIGPGVNGTEMVSGLTVVPQLSEKEVRIETKLPKTVLMGKADGSLNYSLHLQKQAGINLLPVKINVIPPSGYSVDELPLGWEYDPGKNQYIWDGEIKQTTDFQLEFKISNDE